MKKIFLALAISLAVVIPVNAQVEPTSTGARLTLDSVSTEIIICSPSVVRVIKWVGPERPALAKCDLLKVGKGDPKAAADYERGEGHNKYKVNTGRYWAALNDKDGNVSFWTPDEKLILAEQHKTGRLGARKDKKGRREVSQDFQFGRAAVDSVFCPDAGKAVNLRDCRVSVGDAKAGMPTPRVDAGKGWQIVWNSPRPAMLDAGWKREGKKEGDVTFSSQAAPMIDYFFVLDD